MRRKWMKTLALVLAAGMTVLCLAGCGAGEEGGSKTSEGTLTYASQDYTSINPALYEHGEINALLFAGLTAHNEKNEVVPGMAEKWDWDEASKTYTFHLREGLTFHDGEPLTSKDVKFTLNQILDPDNQSEIVSNYQDIQEITCPDDQTVKIRLKRQNAGFPEYMTIGILPEHLLKGKDLKKDEFNQKPVGSGPYKLTDWDPGQSITMEAFDGYYGGAPKINQVVFRIIPDTSARALAVKKGEVDMAQVTPKDAQGLKDEKGLTIHQMKTADYRAIAYNFNYELFKENRELPKALSYAADRKQIIDGVLMGQGQAAYSPIQKNQFNDSSINHYDKDLSKMAEILKQKGWEKNSDGIWEKNGQPLKFTIWAMANDQVRVDMAKMLADQLKKAGCQVDAQSKETLDWENQAACVIGWGSPFDADDHTFKIFTTGAGDNYTYYSDPAVDRALTSARTTLDPDKRAGYYRDFLKAFAADPPYTMIAYIDADYAIRDGVTGITDDTVLGHHGVGVFYNIADWEKK